MPTYEYECGACQHAFEFFQAMSDKPLKVCPACKKRKLIRLIGAGAGIIFKGSGFYETDYKRKNTGAGDKPGEKPAAAADGKPAGDAAPASPPPSSDKPSGTQASGTEAKPSADAKK